MLIDKIAKGENGVLTACIKLLFVVCLDVSASIRKVKVFKKLFVSVRKHCGRIYAHQKSAKKRASKDQVAFDLQHVGSAGGVCPAWNNVDCDYM